MIKKKFNLKGKVALITGAARGIGKGFAEALAEFGANVVIGDLNFESAKKTAYEIESQYNIDAVSLHLDVRSSDSVKKVVKNIINHFGKLDIAINNAGIATNKGAENISDEMWDDLMAINLRGVFLCCREEAVVMIKSGGGNIINTASMSSLIVNHPQKQSHYNTSKAGVVMLTKSLAVEWASYNIRVNCISPGYILTEMNKRKEVSKLRNIWEKMTPVKRLGKVEDLMGAIVFLSSDASSFMTGHNLVIDGGFTLW